MPELSVRSPALPAERGALTRWVAATALEDPWSVLASPLLAGRVVAAWSDPAQDECLVAVGVAWERRLTGSGRFERAAQALEELRDTVEQPAEHEDLPLALGGFAFAPRIRPRGAAWSAWGDGRMWVPELLIHRRGGRGVMVRTAPRGSSRASQLAELHAALEAAPEAPHPSPGGWGAEEGGQEAWHQRVGSALRAMETGALSKVVLARSQALTAPAGQPFDAVATAWALREQQPGCTAWMLHLPEGGSFVGATPEELIRVEGRTLRTVALAGTRRRTSSDAGDSAVAQELLGSGKDRQEQLLVAQAILAALEGQAERVELEERPEVARYAQVQHLRTPIQAALRPGVNPFELLARLHPTPAVGGLPRLEALDWLSQCEGLDRGWYSGPLGWVSARDRATFVVALRSALLQGERGLAYAGCGLVPGSTPEAEWSETLDKLQAVHGALCLRDGSAG